MVELKDTIMFLFIVSLIGVISVGVMSSAFSDSQATESIVNESLSSYSISGDVLSASLAHSPIHSVSRVYNSTDNLTAGEYSFSSGQVQIVLG